MITDEERREVARKLREVNPYRNQSYTVPYNRYTPASEYLSELAGALGYSPENDVSRLEFQSRLADLIEPPRQCPYYHSDRHRCSAYDDVVDRDALLALADEMDAYSIQFGTGLQACTIQAWAFSIRESLGVSK